MKIKRYMLIVMSISALFLGACRQDSIKDIEASASEIESLHGQVVSEINELIEDESNLQDVFDETLETDETLSSLADNSSAVFDNIKTREERLNAIEEIEDQMREHGEIFTSYKGEKLSTDELETVALEVESFVSSLESFRQQYAKTLITQKEYFGVISTEEATFDTFSEGIQEINVEREEIQDVLIDLDNTLVDLDEIISSFQGRIQDVLEESEEG